MRPDTPIGRAPGPEPRDIVQVLYTLVDGVSRAHSAEAIYDEALQALMSSITPDRASVLVFDDEGRLKRIDRVERNDAHRVIEECMLAANVCASDFLSSRKHPALYRVLRQAEFASPEIPSR